MSYSRDHNNVYPIRQRGRNTHFEPNYSGQRNGWKTNGHQNSHRRVNFNHRQFHQQHFQDQFGSRPFVQTRNFYNSHINDRHSPYYDEMRHSRGYFQPRYKPRNNHIRPVFSYDIPVANRFEVLGN